MSRCGGQAAVENHLERTKLPHSIIERIMYTARIRHADRTRFEDCMGFTIKDWHTQVRHSPAPLLRSPAHLSRPPVQEERGVFPEYAVKVFGSNVTLLAERDFLSLSDIHSHMFPKVQRSTTLTLSEPFPLIISGEEDTHKMVRALFTVVLFGVTDLTMSSVRV